jgi:mRNA-degrading endonuclease RelE of RelBE toxin-antitoxin system
MAYAIELSSLAVTDLKAMRVYDRRRVADAIDAQLQDQPGLETRNRKRLDRLVPEFEHHPPVWELRVGDYRVFYDIDDSAATVYVRTIRRKERGQKTEDTTRGTNDR